MFSFPVTIPVRKDDSVFPVFVSIPIDEIAVVKPLLDNDPPFGVESASADLIPLSEIVFVDGRRLPVLETPHIIHSYLDAYTAIEDFYTAGLPIWESFEVEEPAEERDNVVPLFGSKKPCATSEGSTPD